MSALIWFRFCLYVADDAPNSSQAIANLTSFCHTYLANQHEIEIVDVLEDPHRGIAQSIILTPTLIKLTPLPVRRIIGTLSNTQVLLDVLGLTSRAA